MGAGPGRLAALCELRLHHVMRKANYQSQERGPKWGEAHLKNCNYVNMMHTIEICFNFI